MPSTSINSTAVAALFFIAIGMAANGAALAGEIYRCAVDGGTMLTDKPCSGKVVAPAASPVSTKLQPGTLLSQGANRFFGKWHGTLQIQASADGASATVARSMMQASFTIDDDGKFRGSAPTLGCQFRGRASWDDLLESLMVEVIAHDCKLDELNRRYSGQMLNPADGAPATLSLSAAYHTGQPARTALAELSAILRR